METSIVQLLDELPKDNITVKVLKALDFVVPGQWENRVGFKANVEALTGETNPQMIRRIRDRAIALYHNPNQPYQGVVKLYQTIDKADTIMATAALANKVGEKIGFLSFLGNITPKADLTQTIDLGLKLAVEILAYCKLNGLSPNPQAFATSLANNYQDAALMRMSALVCLDGLLPLGPDFLSKIHNILTGTNPQEVAQNPLFSAVGNVLPGNNPQDKVGFVDQGFNAVQGWMNGFVANTGVTPQSVLGHLGNFISIADDNLDFVAAFLDQTTNYFAHTGIQTVGRHIILKAYEEVKAEGDVASSSTSGEEDGNYSIGQTIEVWDDDEEDWYEATIVKIEDDEYFVHYVGYGSSDDEWVDEDEIRVRNYAETDDNGFAVGQKVMVWDDDEEEWYLGIIRKIKGNQYRVYYPDDDDKEWVDVDDIC